MGDSAPYVSIHMLCSVPICAGMPIEGSPFVIEGYCLNEDEGSCSYPDSGKCSTEIPEVPAVTTDSPTMGPTLPPTFFPTLPPAAEPTAQPTVSIIIIFWKDILLFVRYKIISQNSHIHFSYPLIHVQLSPTRGPTPQPIIVLTPINDDDGDDDD